MAGAGRLPRVVWLLPLSTAVAAVLAWTVWCGTENGTWLGGALILMSGLLVLALTHEALPHGNGFRGGLRRWALALVAGGAATAVVLAVAGLGYYLSCPPF